MSNPNLRQSFLPPHDLSASGTPDSSSTNNSMQQGFPTTIPQQFGINNAVPELSAMMFDQSDPFAYPNTMMDLDTMKQEGRMCLPSNSQSQVQPMFLSNSNGSGPVYDDLEGQLFAPLPPYLNLNQSQNFDNGIMGQDIGYTGMPPNDEMANGNFDIFGADGWGNVLGNQRYS